MNKDSLRKNAMNLQTEALRRSNRRLFKLKDILNTMNISLIIWKIEDILRLLKKIKIVETHQLRIKVIPIK